MVAEALMEAALATLEPGSFLGYSGWGWGVVCGTIIFTAANAIVRLTGKGGGLPSTVATSDGSHELTAPLVNDDEVVDSATASNWSTTADWVAQASEGVKTGD